MTKQQSDEIKTVEAFRFAGKLYEDRVDAERALARCNLSDFLQTTQLSVLSRNNKLTLSDVLEELTSHYEQYVALLNKFY